MDVNERQKKIEILTSNLIDVLQLQQTDSIKDTPARVAKMLINEL